MANSTVLRLLNRSLVKAFEDGVPASASSQEAVVLPEGVGLVRQHMVARAGGRPAPKRGAETCSSTRSNWGPSLWCAAVMKGEGWHRPSAARWILVVNPARERPRHSPL